MATAKVTAEAVPAGAELSIKKGIRLLPETIRYVESFQEWEAMPRGALGWARRRGVHLTFGEALDELVAIARALIEHEQSQEEERVRKEMLEQAVSRG